MALDEPKETDEVKAVDGFTYVIDKEFLKLAQPVKVDFIDYGFRLTSSIKIDSGCGGCGSAVLARFDSLRYLGGNTSRCCPFSIPCAVPTPLLTDEPCP